MLEVESLAGEETGSVPEHAFKYPYSDPASKGNVKKGRPLHLAAGKEARWKESILSARAASLWRAALCASPPASLLLEVSLARRIPLWAALLVHSQGSFYSGGKPSSVTPSSSHMRVLPAPSRPWSSSAQPPDPPPGPQGALSPSSHTQQLTNFVSPFRLCQPCLPQKGCRCDDPNSWPPLSVCVVAVSAGGSEQGSPPSHWELRSRQTSNGVVGLEFY